MTALLERLDAEPAFFPEVEAAEVFGTTRSALESCGLLRRAPDEVYDTCDGCDHVGEVVRVEAGGAFYLYLPCPNCGPQQVPPQRLRRWEVSAEPLVSVLAASKRVRGPSTEIVPRALWQLGWVNWDAHSRELFFVRTGSAAPSPEVIGYLNTHRGGIALTTTERRLATWGEEMPTRRLALASILKFTQTGLEFDTGSIVNWAAVWRETNSAKPPKRREKRASRTARIDKLTQALAEHLNAARDHAWNGLQTSGEA